MEILFAVIAFVAFSVITDAIEGQKKKRQQQELPPRQQQDQAKTGGTTQRRPEIVVPPIKNAPSKNSLPGLDPRAQAAYAEKQQKEYSAALQLHSAAKMKKKNKREEDDAVFAAAAQESVRRPTDIHSDVLLNAVAYAQILQPPKAYQYMATRSCRGEWGNQK